MKMKVVGIFFGILLLFGASSGCSHYNGFVGGEEAVAKSYSNVQIQLQRTNDLIPNLVETAKGYANHESEAFKVVAEARSQISAVSKIDPEKIANDPVLQKKLIDAQSNVNRTMVSLNAVREAYPELKANTHFQNLMTNMEGSVNRIAVARRDNVGVVQEYNNSVRRVPGKLWASVFGFHPKVYFEATEEAQSVPKVKF